MFRLLKNSEIVQLIGPLFLIADKWAKIITYVGLYLPFKLRKSKLAKSKKVKSAPLFCLFRQSAQSGKHVGKMYGSNLVSVSDEPYASH